MRKTLFDHCHLGWLSKFGTNSCKQLKVKPFLCNMGLKILPALPSSRDQMIDCNVCDYVS